MSIAAIQWSWTVKGLSPPERLVLMNLADRANDHGECWPGFGTIRDDTELSRRSVVNAVNKLKALGLLTIRHRVESGQHHSNVYTLGVVHQMHHLVQDMHQGSAPDALGVVHQVHPEPKGEPKGNPQEASGAIAPSSHTGKSETDVSGTGVPKKRRRTTPAHSREWWEAKVSDPTHMENMEEAWGEFDVYQELRWFLAHEFSYRYVNLVVGFDRWMEYAEEYLARKLNESAARGEPRTRAQINADRASYSFWGKQ